MSKKGKPRLQKPPRQCLFCSGNASSREHIWSDWMSGFFPRTSHDKSIERWHGIGFAPAHHHGAKIHSKHTSRQTVKAVCRLCNTSWMSRMESEAKPYLEPMIGGRRQTLNEAAQRALVNWIVLKVMVLETTELMGPVFSREETLAFRETGALPETGLKIWLLKADDHKNRARATRNFVYLYPANSLEIPSPEKANTQTVLLRVGKLIIFVSHTTVPELEIGKVRQLDGKVLWPPLSRALIWPPMRSLSAAAEDHLAGTLTRYTSA